MFSSLASLIFGSTYATSSTTGNDEQPKQHSQALTEAQQLERDQDAENTIDVTSSTPSVTGAGHNNVVRQGKRGKNKRNRQQQQNANNTNNKQQGQQPKEAALSITKLLTPSESGVDEDLDEDDWFIVLKEDEEQVSPPFTDSEDDCGNKLQPLQVSAGSAQNAGNPRRRRHINQSHSLYSGPRPQQYRNYLHRSRNGYGAGVRGNGVNVPALSPSRCAANVRDEDVIVSNGGGGITQSLCVVPASYEEPGSGDSDASGANLFMEESWFVTPPPCFTSIGPINIESSPFENLLIEHPSMSVYHSIRSAQEATESFVNLDLGVKESQQRCDVVSVVPKKVAVPAAATEERTGRRMRGIVQPSVAGPRVERYTINQLKEELFARNNQKVPAHVYEKDLCLTFLTSAQSYEKKQRQSLCRGAIKRSNKVREFESKGSRKRRSDLQHCKVVSGANNNRKCCF